MSAGSGPGGAEPVRGPLRLVLASANPNKAAEITEILGDRVVLLPRPPEVPDVVEDADTFEGNARLKAVALVAATGEAALADDSGLVVDALGGAPGVHSARYAGEHATDADNVAKLLAALDGVPTDARTARFRCVVVVRWPDGREVVADGTVEGHVIDGPRGHAGFGYDPVFVPEGSGGRTFAEMTGAAKHAVSHRGRALHTLLTRL
ncbi:MAG: nucleoside-triphosphatase [Acidimicrobiales bacterium]|nr:nucleoside-triphosphatase [Acidimicrobiales bacterium]